MVRIKKVKIENFRNIKCLELDMLKNNVSIITGQNELGKSNALNAINWFFTGKLLTDKWGSGESDINSIKNKEQQKGEYVSVAITFEDEQGNELPTFAKMFKTGYDRKTGIANKHTTECAINDKSCSSITEFERELHKLLNFEKTFYKVDELRLYTDPLYALQKLEAKELRAFLVELGCTVANEEVHATNNDFEILKQYESKYLGDYYAMETDYRKAVKDASKDKEKYQILLEEYNTASFDESKLENALKERDELTVNKNNLLNNTDAEALKLGFEIEKLKLQRSNKIKEHTDNLQTKINSLVEQKQQAMREAEVVKENNLKGITDDFYRKQNEIENLKKDIKLYEANRELLRNQLRGCQDLAKQQVQQKNDYQIKLTIEYDKQYTGYATCPNCNDVFVLDQEEKAKFDTQKQSNIDLYTGYINKCTEVIENSKKAQDEYIKQGLQINAEIDNLYKKAASLGVEANALADKLQELENIPLDYSKVEELQAKIVELENQKGNYIVFDLDDTIQNLQLKKKALENNNQMAIETELNEIQKQLNDIEHDINLMYIERSRYQTKLEYQNKYNVAIKHLNDLDYILNLVVKFNNAYANLLNEKATAKTGIKFVMLEKNLTNDNYTQVCYAVDEKGIPFKDINTSRKTTFGIKFINRIKEIAQADFGKSKNDLPILCDRLEGYDFIEKIKNIDTDSQLICTRVSTNDKIVVL